MHPFRKIRLGSVEWSVHEYLLMKEVGTKEREREMIGSDDMALTGRPTTTIFLPLQYSCMLLKKLIEGRQSVNEEALNKKWCRQSILTSFQEENFLMQR